MPLLNDIDHGAECDSKPDLDSRLGLDVIGIAIARWVSGDSQE